MVNHTNGNEVTNNLDVRLRNQYVIDPSRAVPSVNTRMQNARKRLAGIQDQYSIQISVRVRPSSRPPLDLFGCVPEAIVLLVVGRQQK